MQGRDGDRPVEVVEEDIEACGHRTLGGVTDRADQERITRYAFERVLWGIEVAHWVGFCDLCCNRLAKRALERSQILAFGFDLCLKHVEYGALVGVAAEQVGNIGYFAVSEERPGLVCHHDTVDDGPELPPRRASRIAVAARGVFDPTVLRRLQQQVGDR